MSSVPRLRKHSPQDQNGFTLIELMVVTAVTGFLIVGASSMMVSFSKFKYMADVQEQLKTEATFAANQIDLLIRNSTGLPDLCLASYKIANPTDPVKFCDGTPQYVISSEQVAADQLSNNTAGTDATIIKCTDPNTSNISTGIDSFDTAKGVPATDPRRTSTRPEYCIQTLSNAITCTNSDGPYRTSEDCGTVLPNANEYLIVQVKRTEPVAAFRPSTDQTANSYYIGSTADKANPQTTTRYYNQIIFRKAASSDSYYAAEANGDYTVGTSTQQKLAVFEYEVGTDNNSSAAQTLCINIPSFLQSQGNPDVMLPGTATKKSYYLTSNAVDITNLTFACKLANYGLPSQSAAITYNLTIRKRKRSLNDEFYATGVDDSYNTYSISRTVSVRNSSHPFVFNQTGQNQ